MSEFVAIETQEQFDAAIKGRLEQQQRTLTEKYSGYLSPEDFGKTKTDYESQIENLNKTLKEVNEKVTGFDEQIAERDEKIREYESHSVKTRIAHEAGLSYDAIDFLKGDNEDEIKKSAESLKSIMGKPSAAPLATTETDRGSNKDEALRQTLRKLKGE